MPLTTDSPPPLGHVTGRLSELIVPMDQLSLHTVNLPPMPAHRVQAALAGVLEEQLLDDPAQLHFALAPNAVQAIQAKTSFAVLVCRKDWLTKRIAEHRNLGRSVQRIVPQDPQLQAAGWDLAQFEFRPTSAWQDRMQSATQTVWQDDAWRWARIGALAFVVIQLIGINWWAWHDRSELAAKRNQINRVLTQSFPQTQAIVDAPVQMERAVAALRASSGVLSSKDLERLLADKAQHITGDKPLVKIDYANGTLTSEVAP